MSDRLSSSVDSIPRRRLESAEMLGALVRPQLRAEICLAWNRTRPIVFFDTTRDVVSAVRSGRVDMLIVEMRDALGGSVTSSVFAALKEHPTPIPISVFYPATPIAARAVALSNPTGLALRYIVQSIDTIPRVLEDLHRTATDANAVWPMLSGLIPMLEESIVVIVTTVVLATSHSRVSVNSLAAACGVSTRTLERKVRRGLNASLHDVIGWCTVMHAMWRLDILQMTLKQAAATGGFADAKQLSDQIRRYAAARPREVLQHKGFDGIWSQFVDAVGPRLIGGHE